MKNKNALQYTTSCASLGKKDTSILIQCIRSVGGCYLITSLFTQVKMNVS